MSRYIIKRMLSIIPVFLLATLFTTGMIHLSPVDPAEAYLAAAHIQPTDEVLAQKRSELKRGSHHDSNRSKKRCTNI
ncbi:hypothetical protein QEN29_25600 [Escherichia coli]|nr:hypothetical protein QEN29_25600 [Escherichia coli]